jgi:holo-[acyl-carrier protein] synthase
VSIIGIGVDIEAVRRFEPSATSDRLIERLFTDNEAAYCRDQAAPARHYAARFAAKEATVKALSTILPKLLVTQVEVFKEEESPVPHIRLIKGAVLDSGITCHVSLSHTDEYATAFVVAERI